MSPEEINHNTKKTINPIENLFLEMQKITQIETDFNENYGAKTTKTTNEEPKVSPTDRHSIN